MPLLEDRVSIAVEKILLATDFSLSSEKAAAYAKGMAQRFSSTVEIAHVFDPSVVPSYEEEATGEPLNNRLRATIDRLEEIKSELNNSGIQAETALPEGHRPFAALLRIAKEHQVDLVVVGTESKLGVERLILGSTAEELIRNAQVPVLTVGPNARLPQKGPLAFKRIIYATDFSKESARTAAYVLSFAQDSGAHLYFCYVLSFQPNKSSRTDYLDEAFQSALNRIIPQSSYDWCNPECVVGHGDAAKAILELAEKVEADLIVLGARKASFWLTHIAHGLTPDLLAQATCPVLTVC